MSEAQSIIAERLRQHATVIDHGDHVASHELSAVMREAADRIEYLESVAGAVSQHGTLTEASLIEAFRKRQLRLPDIEAKRQGDA